MINSPVSVVVPTYNEEGNVQALVERLNLVFSRLERQYEIIFVDDRSKDRTQEIIRSLQPHYPIKLLIKRPDQMRGKAQSLLGGFKYSSYDTVVMIDADLQYPPEAIAPMLAKMENGADIVVASRSKQEVSWLRRIPSRVFLYVFGKMLHGLDCDVQSGLKVFRKEILERFTLNPSPWTFDLEFLVNARDAGYTIGSEDIVFAKRTAGEAKVNLIKSSYEIGMAAIKVKFRKPKVMPFTEKARQEKGHGFHFRGLPFVPHSELPPHETALQRLHREQIVSIVIGAIVVILAFVINWHLSLIAAVALLTILYFADLLFNFFLILRSFSKPPEITFDEAALQRVPDSAWPAYTIFCPLYKEWEVLPQFITAMSKLDYPKDKLQVMLLLEEDDQETIEKAKSFNLPDYFDIVVVPHSKPKTKPKACNYGLLKATGEYIVIYDAEDVPDQLQLKKAVRAFQIAGEKVICIQAKLNFYNPHQNLLTRVFTAEYSLWFDLVLTGLQSINAPIPLGGTSNHFRAKDLQKLRGWDAFNVTEDCDLGIRLVKRGYRTAIIDSVTLEEANSDLNNWFWQRTRWIKGYIQSYLVHTRDLKSFRSTWREPHAVTFQLVVGGKILSMYINPFMWMLTIIYFAFRTQTEPFIQSLFPGPILYMGVFSLVFGNFLYLYYYMIGCAKREHYDLIKYVFLVPLYWLAMSVAAWVSLYKLIVAPHHWSKTKHGLHLNHQKAMEQTQSKIGRSLVDSDLVEVVGNPKLVLQRAE